MRPLGDGYDIVMVCSISVSACGYSSLLIEITLWCYLLPLEVYYVGLRGCAVLRPKP